MTQAFDSQSAHPAPPVDIGAGTIPPNAPGMAVDPGGYDDEIDLFELFIALWRQKFLIAGVTLACVAAAVVYLLTATPLYEVNAQIRPGITAYDDEKPVYGWSVEDIQAWIKDGYYQPYALAAWDRPGAPPKVTSRGSRNGQFVTLSLRTANIEDGKRLLQEILEHWVRDYAGGTDTRIQATARGFQQEISRLQDQVKSIQEVEAKELDNRIAERTREMKTIEQKIQMVKEQQRVQQESLEALSSRLEKSLENTDELSRLLDQLIKKGQAEGLSFLLYTNIIQQNIYHVSDLQKRVADLQGLILQYDQQIDDLTKQSADVKDAILQLQQKKAITLAQEETEVRRKIDLIEARAKVLAPIDVIARPFAGAKPVAPRPLLTLALAGFLGVMLGLMAAWVRSGWRSRTQAES